jgi:long-subunit fatty acid transport protein
MAARYSRIKTFYFLGALFIVLTCSSHSVMAQAPMIDITSSPNPVGSGARALGMGGAFIAVADDATAASWNPGGLIQLERPEISAVGEVLYRAENNQFGQHPEASGRQSVSSAGLNYLSAVYPFTALNRNMIVSLNYQHLYDFSRNWNLTYEAGRDQQNLNYAANGGLYAWGLAYALQIIPQLSFGFTLNIWENGIYQNAWDTALTGTIVHKPPVGNQIMTYKISEQNHYTFSGFNANVGLLWNVTERLALGAVFKTPFTGDVTHQFTYQSRQVLPSGDTPAGSYSQTTKEKLAMPMSYGFGVAFRFSDRLTFSTDVSHTAWQDFILTTQDGQKISPITKGPAREANIPSTTQVRIGSEYLFIRPKYTVPVRVGFFYDPAPSPGTADNYLGVSLGSGISIGRFVFDAAYVYRFGRNVGKSTIPDLDFSQDVNEHSFYTSMIIHF